MNSSLGIIIVNYNSGSLLNKCVNAVFDSEVQDLKIKVVVVDNNSKDNSLTCDKITKKSLKLIQNTENKGFGYACNQGVEALGKIDYLLFLNPDTEISKHALINSIEFLKQNTNISILGCRHLDELGNTKLSCSNTPTPIRIVWDILGLSKLSPKLFTPASLMTNFDHKDSKFVDQVMGAYMLMEKLIFDNLGGFDTRFFVYYEDADFALRAKKMGFLSYYNSNIEILHQGRGTTKGISHISLFYYLRSRIQFMHKHYGKLCGTFIMILTLIIEPLTRVLFALIKNPSEIKSTITSFKLLYKYYLQK